MFTYFTVFYLIYSLPNIFCVNDNSVGTVGGIFDSLDSCMDPLTNRTYKLGDKWKSEYVDGCALSSCSKININEYPKFTFPFIIQYKCVDPKPPDNDSRGCHMIRPYADQPYPHCCKHMVCFRDDFYIVMYPILNESEANKFGVQSHEISRYKRYNYVTYRANRTRNFLINMPFKMNVKM